MLIWSEYFATGITTVDDQHQRLFELLNRLIKSFEVGMPDEDMIASVLQELLDYANQHFSDEETLMTEHHIDERHLSIHRMEHKSFNYDLQKLQLHTNVDEDEVQTAERLVRFITSWLIYHILGIDMIMAAQLRAIEQGLSPQQAYESYKKIGRDATTTQLILDAVLDLWRGSTEHCRVLEAKLASYQK
ncbi:Bacteriohemerythrin [Patescibacteria group bacterium]|nr:Bacteriohemerythrin [Patescibacteria group bacterium]